MECDRTNAARNRDFEERTSPQIHSLTLVPALGDVEHPYIPENLGIAYK